MNDVIVIVVVVVLLVLLVVIATAVAASLDMNSTLPWIPAITYKFTASSGNFLDVVASRTVSLIQIMFRIVNFLCVYILATIWEVN